MAFITPGAVEQPVSGNSSPFLSVTRTFNNAQIKSLGTTQLELIAATEILNYAAEPTSMPYPVMCNGWMLNPNHVGYNNVAIPTNLDLCWGSDYSGTVAHAVEWNNADPPTYRDYGNGIFNGANWNVSFVMGPNPFGGISYLDNGLYLSLNGNGSQGDLTNGDAAATLTLTTIYYVSSRP